MKSTKPAPGLMLIVSATLSCGLLCSCATLERDYRLQSWEKYRVNAERAMKKRQHRFALAMARESVDAAEGFGDSDFRLGVSLCVLGNAERAADHLKEAEAAYRKSVKVLMRAQKNASQGSRNDQLAEVTQKLVAEDLTESLVHLGDLYLQEERYSDAAKCFDRAVSIFEALINTDTSQSQPNDLVVGQQYFQCLLNLARAAAQSNNIALADRSFQQALRIAASPSCGEYQRRDVRDEYLKLLQSQGRQNEAPQLVADVLFNQYTADGTLALSEGDYTAAEIAYRKALPEAGTSIFSEQRVLRGLLNLILVFAREGKVAEVIRCSRLADDYVRSHPQSPPRDYDQIQEALANFYIVSNIVPAAREALLKQLPYRGKQFGKHSKELCMTFALLGIIEQRAGNIPAAERCAQKAYRLIKMHPVDRSYFATISRTADLTLLLGHFKETEELDKRLITIRISGHDEADPFVTSLRANLLVLYQRYQKHDEARQTVNEMIRVLEKADSNQRAAAFPYVGLSLTSCLTAQWYDLATPLTKLGQSILMTDLGGTFPNELAKNAWTTDMAIMQKHFNNQ